MCVLPREHCLLGAQGAMPTRQQRPPVRLSRIARSLASKRRRPCAIPGCTSRGIVGRCCGQPTCVKCLARTLRTALDDRLRVRCPFCRTQFLVPDSTVRRLMARACPITHATVIECSGGPPAVLAHFCCPEGHYVCKASSIRLLSVAQKMLVHHLQLDLDRFREKNAQLACQLASMRAGP